MSKAIDYADYIGDYVFVIDGYVIPYVRMTARSKHLERAQNYIASQDAIGTDIKSLMTQKGWEMFPEGVPLGVRILFTVYKSIHKSDLDNKVKAVLDAMQGVVYQNDMWIDHIIASRVLDETLQDDRTEIEIWTL